jgi:hypothetical protein
MRGPQWRHPMTIVHLLSVEQVQVPVYTHENLQEAKDCSKTMELQEEYETTFR